MTSTRPVEVVAWTENGGVRSNISGHPFKLRHPPTKSVPHDRGKRAPSLRGQRLDPSIVALRHLHQHCELEKLFAVHASEPYGAIGTLSRKKRITSGQRSKLALVLETRKVGSEWRRRRRSPGRSARIAGASATTRGRVRILRRRRNVGD